MTSDLLQQTHRGKLSLITLIQNLPHQTFSDLPEIIFDENGRYLKLKEDKTMKKSFLEKAIQQIKTDNQSIHDIIQQQTIPGEINNNLFLKILVRKLRMLDFIFCSSSLQRTNFYNYMTVQGLDKHRVVIQVTRLVVFISRDT
jgi:hypothetical protein